MARHCSNQMLMTELRAPNMLCSLSQTDHALLQLATGVVGATPPATIQLSAPWVFVSAAARSANCMQWMTKSF